MVKSLDLKGEKFGKLVVLEKDTSKNSKRSYWICLCECGKNKSVAGTHLKTRHTKSCGCLHKPHGMEGTPEYKAYGRAKARCEKPNFPNYEHYGGRGIEFRFASFQDFFKELGFRPSTEHSVDRINVNGHYEKGNVKWSTPKEQSRNKRNNHLLTAKGSTLTVAEWSEITGLTASIIGRRISKYGWCTECAVTLPKRTGTVGNTKDFCKHKNDDSQKD